MRHRADSAGDGLQAPARLPVLALVLGDMAETAFRQSMLLSGGSLTVFWSNGLVGSIVTLALVILCWPLISRGIGTWKKKTRDSENV